MFSEQLAVQRLAEAPVIEAEWAAMSYKDRASWWMSAKWYGYMSTEAYRRGDAPTNTSESCRYGEPGFFIATRVPYYDAQAAVSTIVAATHVAPAEQEAAPSVPSTTVVEALTIPSKPATESNPAPAPAPALDASEIIVPTATPSEESTEQSVAKSTSETIHKIVGSIDSTNTPLLAAAIPTTASSTNKKKKKNKHHTGEGKTIQIRVGGGTN